MFNLFVKIALRHIWRRKIYTIINIVGLAISIAVFVLIGLYIINELSYEKHFKNASHIYRIVNIYQKEGLGEKSACCPFPLAEAFSKKCPEIVKKTVRFFNFLEPHTLIEYNDRKFNEKRLYLTDSTVFDVFNFDFIAGKPDTALNKPLSVVITKSTAIRYFDNENPIGKTLLMEEGFPLQVTGVINDPLPESHLNFDLLVSMSTLNKIMNRIPENWVWAPCWTYVLFKENFDTQLVNNKLVEIVNDNYRYRKDFISYELQPITDIHLKSTLEHELERNSNSTYLTILLSIAIFILVIAFINFMNLTIAGSFNRAKEVGIKKVFGADRKYLIIQFLLESTVLTSISLLLGLIIAEQSLPLFNQITSKTISFNIILENRILIPIIIFGILSGFFAGLYPAISLSSFLPIKVLHRSFTSVTKNTLPRKVLVVVQYTISIILLIITIVNIRQLIYLKTADLGFNKAQIIILPICKTPIQHDYESFKEDLLKYKTIGSVTAMSEIIGVNHNLLEITPVGFPNNKKHAFPNMVVTSDFVSTFEIKVLAGKDFSKISEDEKSACILINESAAAFLGCKTYNEAIGKTIITFQQELKIVGVISDFNINSLHKASGPLILSLFSEKNKTDWETNFIAIRSNADKFVDALRVIKKEWKKYASERPFEFSFLDLELDKLYKNEEILVKLTAIFTFIAVFIASLGILGLTSFFTQQRTKEIGMRKVLGASVYNIIEMLAIEFLKLILIANFIAWPFAFLFVNWWLSNFAYQINLQLWMFTFAALIAIFFAIIMVSFESLKAALSNPVTSLRYE